MFYQSAALIEIQFLVYWSSVIIGLQLGIFFFYEYYKIKDVHLKLNRILLSIGSFIVLVIVGALFLVVVRLFDLYTENAGILYKIGFTIVFLAPIAFLAFINIEEYSRILDLKLSRILMVLNIIPIVIIFIVPSIESLLFRLSMVFMVLISFYVIYFQIRFIRTVVGDIKKRMQRFFIGELLCLGALAFAAQVQLTFLSLSTEAMFFTGTLLLLFGFLIMFYSAYEFPPVYEFEWRLNLINLVIINSKKNTFLYSYDFSGIKEKDLSEFKEDRDKLFSGGLMGIDDLISSITDTQQEKINKIKKGDSFILLEYGTKFEAITYVLRVKKDLASFNYILKYLKNQFENFFKEILLSLEEFDDESQSQKLFSSFDIFVNNLIK